MLKQRVGQLEGAAQRAEAMRQENALLRQQLMEVEAAVSGSSMQGRRCLGVGRCCDGSASEHTALLCLCNSVLETAAATTVQITASLQS